MCLITDDELTTKMRAKLKKYGRIRMWKLLEFDSELNVGSPFQYMNYKSGWNKSNRPGIVDEYSDTIYGVGEAYKVNRGIHVNYISTKLGLSEDPYRVSIPVYCLEKDFVAAGHWSDNDKCKQAVFMKVYINAADMKKAKAVVKAKQKAMLERIRKQGQKATADMPY